MKTKYLFLLLTLFVWINYIHGQSPGVDPDLTIGKNAFYGLKTTEGVTLPPSLVSIGNNAFQSAQVPYLDFTQSLRLEQIRGNAFYNAQLSLCNVLDFSNCDKLLCFNNGGSSFAGFEGQVILPHKIDSVFRRTSLETIGNSAFYGLKLTEESKLDFTDSHKLATIGNSAFQNSGIKEIALPDSLQRIGNNAFAGCVQLNKITSHNPIPPALGTTVFTSVDTLTCKLRVPEEGLDVYGTVEQWKSFLNRKVIGTIDPDDYQKGEEGSVYIFIPTDGNGIDFKAYDFDNPDTLRSSGIVKTYKTVDIGEYTWTAENIRLKSANYSWMNFSQKEIDEKLGNNTLAVSQFEDVYGTWTTLYDRQVSYLDRFSVYDRKDGALQEGWSLPTMTDFSQLFGQAPIIDETNPITNILYFLGANQKDVPASHTLDWFKYSNTSGFTMTPLGWRINQQQPYGGELWENFGVESIIRLKEPYKGRLHFNLSEQIKLTEFYHFSQARYTRKKTEAELGYKLLVDIQKDSVLILPASQQCSEGLLELPNGLERGITLRYVNKDSQTILRTWTQIQKEGQDIRRKIPSIPPMSPLVPCIPVTGVTLNKKSLTLKVEESESLTATVIPADAINKDVAWSSANENIATVDSQGKVTAVSEGKTEIIVTTQDGGKTATCTVTVIAPVDTDKLIDPDATLTASKLSADQNYIRTITYTQAVTSIDESKGLDQIQYFDGLGRPVQTVMRNITPTGQSLVSLQEYDAFGREDKVWLPVHLPNQGAYTQPQTVQDAAQGIYDDQAAYSRPQYEASPLNRILEQYGPGKDWHDNKKSVKTDYLTNEEDTSGELYCINYTVGGTRMVPSLSKPSGAGYYPRGELYVTKVTDEDDNTGYEFKDKLGQVVLTRQMGNGLDNKDGRKVHDTYYVYDDFGNLCFVLPPMAAGIENASDERFTHYAYQYKYDDRNRCTEKKLPGADPVYYIYDKADRLIFTQDGEQRAKAETQSGKNQWTFTVNDELGRLAMTGIVTGDNISNSTFNSKLVKANYDKQVTGNIYGYTIDNFEGIDTVKILTVNYYDSYDFLDGNTALKEKLDYDQAKETSGSSGKRYIQSNQGMLTGTMVSTLTSEIQEIPDKLYMAFYYDNRGRIVQAHTTNHLNGTDKEYTTYHFDGLPEERELVHSSKNISQSRNQKFRYEYDHARRLKQVFHRLDDGQEITLAHNLYDELGRVITAAPGTNKGHVSLQTSYSYNIRSWAESTVNNLYEQYLKYSYGGNIEEQEWIQDGKTRQYTFSYDQLSRLATASSTKGENFSTGYTYDMHGNMKTLERWGEISQGSYDRTDVITIGHTGNQMKSVTQGIEPTLRSGFSQFVSYYAGEDAQFIYNHNGALAEDNHKGRKYTYNILNLPEQIVIDNTNAKVRNYYAYSAAGIKLRVTKLNDPTLKSVPVEGTLSGQNGETDESITDYAGNIIYEDNTLKRILVDGGYIEDGKYHFFVTDHLGNNRVVTDLDGQSLQSTHYYPFGMSFAELSVPQSLTDQPYKYNGKELDTDHGLNLYDYAARFYNPEIPAFTSIDPLAEKYYSISPYVYVANNPLIYVDPDGEAIGTVISTIFGAAKGAYDAHKNGTSIKAGLVEGATSGLIYGATLDLLVGSAIASGGGTLLIIGAGVVGGVAGGAISTIVGDQAGQVANNIETQNMNIEEAVQNTNPTPVEKVQDGMKYGLVGGVVGSGTGKAVDATLNAAKSGVRNTMSKNITETTKTLKQMGANDNVINEATQKIQSGMSKLGGNINQSQVNITTVTGTATESGLKAIQIHKEKEQKQQRLNSMK